jgi:hypothetical protein
MLDISITAQKDRRDPYSPLPEGPDQPVKLAGQALLSDSQNTFLGTFIIAHLPRKDHEAFRRSVLSRLLHFSIRLGVSRVREIRVAFFFGNTFEKRGDCSPKLLNSASLHFA